MLTTTWSPIPMQRSSVTWPTPSHSTSGSSMSAMVARSPATNAWYPRSSSSTAAWLIRPRVSLLLLSMLTTNQRGAVAETAIIHEAVKLGIGVYQPVADERTDLIFDLHPRLVRVQCKTAACYGD